jgi:hypothetical protein
VVLQHCDANPLITLQFLFNIISNDLVEIQHDEIIPKKRFLENKELKDWAEVPVPALA